MFRHSFSHWQTVWFRRNLLCTHARCGTFSAVCQDTSSGHAAPTMAARSSVQQSVTGARAPSPAPQRLNEALLSEPYNTLMQLLFAWAATQGNSLPRMVTVSSERKYTVYVELEREGSVQPLSSRYCHDSKKKTAKQAAMAAFICKMMPHCNAIADVQAHIRNLQLAAAARSAGSK